MATTDSFYQPSNWLTMTIILPKHFPVTLLISVINPYLIVMLIINFNWFIKS